MYKDLQKLWSVFKNVYKYQAMKEWHNLYERNTSLMLLINRFTLLVEVGKRVCYSFQS